MAIIQIPTRTDNSNYREIVDLEGRSYVFDFHWNARTDGWFFDLLDADEIPIKMGTRIVTGFPLLRLISDLRRPPGEIFAIDTVGLDREPSEDNLGTDILLVYAEAADVAEALL